MQLLILKDDKVTQKKGDIIEVRATGTPFGGKEPLSFVLVEVPSVPMTAYEHYSQSWDRVLDFEVVGQDLAQDGFRIRMFSTLTSAELGAVTRDDVQAFIESWGGTIFSFGINEVVFDIRIYNALISNAFWEIDTSGVVFSEVSYDQGTGIHRIEADYSALGNSPTYVERYVRVKGLDIVSHSDRVLAYDAQRSIVRDCFQDDLKRKGKMVVARRRYYVNPGVVDYIVSQGGVITTDETTLLSYIKDKVE